jgi:multicomponent K+:H+ antiporter subunit G
MLENVWEWIVVFHLVVGGAFVFIGSLGLLRLQNTMARMHAPSKATTVGIGGVLVASMFYFFRVTDETHQLFAAQDLLIVCFLFLTAPVSAHFMSKAYLHKHAEEKPQLPVPPGAAGW